MRRWSALLTVAVASLASATDAPAATLIPLASDSAWTSTPIHAASPPGDPRLFVVERGGGVRIVNDGALRAAPFLTVPNVDTVGERGLLSIAFAPDYATSGLLYAFAVAKGPDALDPSGEPGDLRVIEYRRSASDPDLADPTSARLVLAQSHSGATNHNGGQLAFGPEGLLYVTMGDAANGSNAQSLANDLGKVLRIDPHPPSGVGFGSPTSNPFVGIGGARPEIYALGLRNPFRASFAPGGDLVLPDVGENTWEEVSVGRPTGTAAATTLAGANLGWPSCEGACSPPNASFVDPAFQYAHSGPVEATGCAIIGGYVVRDPALTGLSGRYLYGDLCRKDLRTLNLAAAGGDPRPAGISIPADENLLGFGEDGRGCVYAMTTGTVYRVAESAADGPSCPPRSALSSAATATRASLGAADTARPKLSLLAGRRQPLRRFLAVAASCDETCSLRAGGAVHLSLPLRKLSPPLLAATRSVRSGERVRLRPRLSGRAFERAERARERGSKAIARVQVVATDASGNSSTETLRIRLG